MGIPEVARGRIQVDAGPVGERRAVERRERVVFRVDQDLVHRGGRKRAIDTAVGRQGAGRRRVAAVERGEQDGGIESTGRRGFLGCLGEGEGRQAVGEALLVERLVGGRRHVGVVRLVGCARGAGRNRSPAAGCEIARELGLSGGEQRRQVDGLARGCGIVDVERVGERLGEVVARQRPRADDVERIVDAEHDAAVAIFRGPQHRALVEAWGQHRQQDAVRVGVGGVTTWEGRVGGEAVQRGRIELVDAVRRDLHGTRAAVHVLARLRVGDPVGEVEHAVGRVGQAVEAGQAVAGRRHGRDRNIAGRRDRGVRGRPVGEVVLGDAEIAARQPVVGRGQELHHIAERAGRAVLHALHVERAEHGTVGPDGLRRRHAAAGRRRLVGQAAGEIGRDTEDRHGAERRRAQCVGGVAEQVLVADRECLLLGRRTVVVRDRAVETALQGLVADRTRVERQKRRQQIEHVDVGRRDVGRLGDGRPGCQGCRQSDEGRGRSEAHARSPCERPLQLPSAP